MCSLKISTWSIISLYVWLYSGRLHGKLKVREIVLTISIDDLTLTKPTEQEVPQVHSQLNSRIGSWLIFYIDFEVSYSCDGGFELFGQLLEMSFY